MIVDFRLLVSAEALNVRTAEVGHAMTAHCGLEGWQELAGSYCHLILMLNVCMIMLC